MVTQSPDPKMAETPNSWVSPSTPKRGPDTLGVEFTQLLCPGHFTGLWS